jgi:hypothetical protein
MSKSKYEVETPILFLTYNRPKETIRVLKKILKISPNKLYINSDGPKSELESETINNLREKIDFLTQGEDVTKFYWETNLGCRNSVITSLNKIFETCEKLIIIEDDVYPTIKFFKFCEASLEKYSNNPKVSSISGFNYFMFNKKNKNLLFSKYFNSWGWATWQNRWEQVGTIDDDFKDEILNFKNLHPDEHSHFLSEFKKVKHGQIDSWAYDFAYHNFKYELLTVTPKYNLIKNIGFGNQVSTHTKNKYSLMLVSLNKIFSILQRVSSLPGNVKQDVEYDYKKMRRVILKDTLFNKVSYKAIKKLQ